MLVANLCTTTEAKKRFNEYIEMVNNHWTGHLSDFN